MKEGVNPSQIFCSGNNTAEATGTPSGSGVATKTGASASKTGTDTPDKTGAASAVLAPQGVSKAGLGMLGMLVVSAFAGALL